MSRVELKGSIPVTVVVEVDDADEQGSVSRVIAHDELFEYETNDEGFQVTGDMTLDVDDPGPEATVAQLRAFNEHQNKTVALAKEIAEGSIWPGWEWGW